MKFHEIEDVVSMKAWSMSSGKNYLILVLLAENKEILTKIHKFLHRHYNLEEIYVEIETKEEREKILKIQNH